MKLKIGNMIRGFMKPVRRKSLLKKLGYPANAKLLIIHADDLGFSASENKASIDLLENGSVNSGSVMVPCDGFGEIADYARSHPDADIGIHLTVLSEWDTMRWKPVLPKSTVPSLLTEDGFFLESKVQLLRKSDPSDIEKEFVAQIELASHSGIDPTHLDSHMYSAFTNRRIFNRYISIGRKYRLPVLLPYSLPLGWWVFRRNMVMVENLHYARPSDFETGLPDYYRRILGTLGPGLNCLLLHPAINDAELQDITRGRSGHGGEWRQADYNFFIDGECRNLIKDNNIHLITWREIRNKLYR